MRHVLRAEGFGDPTLAELEVARLYRGRDQAGLRLCDTRPGKRDLTLFDEALQIGAGDQALGLGVEVGQLDWRGGAGRAPALLGAGGQNDKEGQRQATGKVMR